MTREHLWPAALHSRLLAANKQSVSKFWLARLQKEIPNEPQLRDVCDYCNNVVLSELDAYICRLFDVCLIRIPSRYDRVSFTYDYHLLKRWLLKLCFNSARIHKSRDLFALEAVLLYIMGRANSLGRSVQLFVQLSYPEEVPEEDLRGESLIERPVLFVPAMNRAGHTFFQVPGVGRKLLRAVHLRSFTFFLAFFRPDENAAVRDDFAKVFCGCLSNCVLLRPSMSKVELICNGQGAWTSFKGSRQNQLVFDDNTKPPGNEGS
jgi:hypothetical protein